ncbi:hypothetical protein FB451DRAFT_464130 [Mycena latifolia]|nr:hypothetical protein FB451DRAFT_464130 [Mycena latifolia]
MRLVLSRSTFLLQAIGHRSFVQLKPFIPKPFVAASRSPDSKVCPICGVGEHSTSACPMQQCSNCGRLGGHGQLTTCPYPQMCHFCIGELHTVEECLKRQITRCFICDATDHQAFNCPERASHPSVDLVEHCAVCESSEHATDDCAELEEILEPWNHFSFRRHTPQRKVGRPAALQAVLERAEMLDPWDPSQLQQYIPQLKRPRGRPPKPKAAVDAEPSPRIPLKRTRPPKLKAPSSEGPREYITQLKRKPGRPRKANLLPLPSELSLLRRELSALRRKIQLSRRKLGRPPKVKPTTPSDKAPRDQSTHLPELKRKRGRPSKPTPEAASDGSHRDQSPHLPQLKRKRGRPPKPKLMAQGPRESVSQLKRGPGRPPKPKLMAQGPRESVTQLKRKPGRPPKPKLMAQGPRESLTQLKRKPGRPPKPKLVTQGPGESGTQLKRKPGRPPKPKSTAPSDERPREDITQLKRKPGRLRKSSLLPLISALSALRQRIKLGQRKLRPHKWKPTAPSEVAPSTTDRRLLSPV